jgi:ADP-ribosylglycohydrolase
MSNIILSGIMGLCIGDALGVPVEFESRDKRKKDAVGSMRSHGTYDQPAGTWSDDSSMALCLAESLTRGLDYKDIMKNFSSWYNNGEFTPYGEVFDVGGSTAGAIMRYDGGTEPLECGGKSQNDNGNGSLMRILPLVFYLKSFYGSDITKDPYAMDIIHKVSSLTHAHTRSLIACGIYCSVAMELIGGKKITEAFDSGIKNSFDFYGNLDGFKGELKFYENLKRKDFKTLGEEEIKSSGYVVDTLEAALWCLLNSDSYSSCVLKAVNLGSDTDTVAAVAGGLAGIFYGYESIPAEWIDTIARRDYIEKICTDLYSSWMEKVKNER